MTTLTRLRLFELNSMQVQHCFNACFGKKYRVEMLGVQTNLNTFRHEQIKLANSSTAAIMPRRHFMRRPTGALQDLPAELRLTLDMNIRRLLERHWNKINFLYLNAEFRPSSGFFRIVRK